MTQAAAPRLELRHSQSLVMTQQLQQSIKLLQMTALEAQAFIEDQLQSNPFLTPDEGAPADEQADAPAEENSEDNAADEAFMPEEWRDDAGFADGGAARMHVTSRDPGGDPVEAEDIAPAREVTLREHLLEQLHVEVADPVLRGIGMHLIDLTDETGYLTEDLNALAEQLGTDLAHVEQALAAVQSFDPAGVCARTLQECLSLQLKERDRYDPAMAAMIAHLHLLARGELEGLRRACGVDMEDLKGMVAELRALDPKPGLTFGRDVTQTVEPDVTVRRDPAGNWHVELNASALPRVLVNRRYYARIAAQSKGQDRKYLTERLHEANWLVRALDQRANTILKVATEIVAQQENFFRMGIHHLKPLTLKDIARETGFHESTVSRVTSGKYLISPRGTYELKYFFTSGLSHKAGGEDVSSQTVKHLIRELIEKEADTVLSDDDLTERLRARNINVARRTVAKYREALSIPSSMQRRRQKAALLP